MDAGTGALKAVIGGYSFAGNKFNRATQARRQPGSSFKPFVYSAAFDKGFNPASIVLDAPVVFRDRRGHMWRPQNDGGGFSGPMRLREALVRSKNLVSVRLLDSIGVDFARKYISQFGFAENELPPNLSMSLGTASLTRCRWRAVTRPSPWRLAGHAVVHRRSEGPRRQPDLQGNSGSRMPRLRLRTRHVLTGRQRGRRLQPGAGHRQARAKARREDRPAGHAIARRCEDRATCDRRTHFVPTGVDDARRGAARHRHRRTRASTAKTWAARPARPTITAMRGSAVSGGSYATVVWVGRDDFRSLGRGEYGGRAALPIWIDYMRVALKDQPIARNDPPDGMVQVQLNGATEWIKTEDLDRIHEFDEFGPRGRGAG